MEQLDSCMLVDLRGFFSRIQGSGSSVGGDAWSGEALQVYGPRYVCSPPPNASAVDTASHVLLLCCATLLITSLTIVCLLIK